MADENENALMEAQEKPKEEFGRRSDKPSPEEELKAAQERIAQLEHENMHMMSELDMANNISGVPILHSQHIEGLGKFIVPAENTLQNHFSLIYDRDNLLDFSAEQSPAFDGVMEQHFRAPAFSLPEHPHYFDYEPLRDNVSVVRNYVMQSLLSQHDIRDPDEFYTVSQKMEEMSSEIGKALQRDNAVFSRPGSVKLSTLDASAPGTGAAMIYDLLCKKQESSKSFSGIKNFFGVGTSEWNLAPIESSPFSKANVDAFCLTHPPQVEPEVTPQPEPAPVPQPTPEATAEKGLSQAQKLAALGTGIAGAAFSLDRVHALSQPVKTRSVELAREILDKLRVTLGGTSQDQWLELPAEAAMQANESLRSISSVYADLYQQALQVNPALEQDATMQQSNAAMGKLAYLMKQQAGMKLIDEGRADEASLIMQELETYPEAWQPAPNETPDILLAQVQTGMDQAQATLQLQSPAQPALAGQQQQAPSAAEQLQQLLQNGNLSQQELAAIRDMQAQANSMQADAPIEQLQKHAKKADRESASSLSPEGGYRKAVQQPQAETQIKR